MRSCETHLHKCYCHKTSGRLFGVCARLADHLDLNVVLVRILALVALFFAPMVTFVVYLIFGLIL